MQDKRRSFRLPVELPTSFKVYEEQTHVSLGMVNEISALGFSFTTKEFISAGQELSMVLRFPDGQRVTLPVKTVWSRQESYVDMPEYMVGVKLCEPLTPQTALYIRLYVRYFFATFSKKIVDEK
ncbi:MAG: PilZ domain-containing protein [Candidatus Omnitrophica bacterium]|nr:PilZ domain-containing protein [Candidatus Omnitrophota bacterium]